MQPSESRHAVAPATAHNSFLPTTDAGMKNMVYEGCRLASLASLPPSCSASRLHLAAAGFYYDISNTIRNKNNHHELVCFACGFTCSKWDTGESPTEIHQRSAPDCSFVKNFAKTSVTFQLTTSRPDIYSSSADPSFTFGKTSTRSKYSSGQISPACTSGSSTSSNLSSSQNNEVIDGKCSGDLTTDCAAIASAPGHNNHHVTQSGIQSRSSHNQQELCLLADRPTMSMDFAVYPQFSTSQSRLETFRTWPPSHFFSPQDLVPLGFFYAGYADCIRCFYCGVGLKSWEPGDDVIQEHIRWRPSCGFILATRGRRFVKTVLTHMQLTHDETKDDDSEKSPESREESRMACSSRTERNLKGSSYISVDIVSNEPRDLASRVMNQVQETGLPPELVACDFQEVTAKGCQETHASAALERIVEKLQVPDSRRTTDESPELQTDGAATTETEARLQQLRQENARLRARTTCRTCTVAVVGVIFLPCGHVVNCSQCGSKARHCCLCSEVIRATANVFLI